MKGLILTVIISCLVALTATSFAQESDQCVVHIDKPVYVTGEVVWYKVYLPAFLHETPFTVLASVHDASGDAIEQYFVRTEGQSAFGGYYKIPFDLDAGIYRLNLSVHSQEINDRVDLVNFAMPIYNDLKKGNENISLSEKAVAPVVANQLQVAAELDDKIKLRDAVVANIRVTDESGQPASGDISISVTDRDLLSDLPYAQSVFRGPSLERSNLQNLQNSIYLKGTVFREATNEPVALNVLGGYSGTDNRIYYTKSFEDGRFLMRIPDYTGSKPIQFLGYHREENHIRVELDEVRIDAINDELRYTNGILEYMNWSRLRKKIFQYYDTQETVLDPQAITYPVQELDPDATYIMDEYEPFETVGGFFNELMSAVSFSLDDDSLYQASMYNPSGRAAKNTYLNGPPLFIIDDKATRNADFAARMSASPIETMELFLQPKKLLSQFNALGISGVVRIKTRLKDVEVPQADREDVFAISGLQASADFPPHSAQTDTNHPLFAPVLHWVGDGKTDANGSAIINFTQSDDISRFEVRIVTVDAQGRLGEGSSSFESLR